MSKEKKKIRKVPLSEVYNALIQGAEDLIYVLDRYGFFLFVNPWLARFLEKNPEEIVGKYMDCVFSETDIQEQLMLVEQVFAGAKSLHTEYSIRKEDLSYQFIANLTALKDKKGSIYGVLGIARDISETRSLEKQLVSAEKLASLGTLAAGIAHQINNPLAIILGFCDLLLERTDSESLIYRDLKTIERHGLYCKKVVQNLLSFARITEEQEESAEVNGALEMVLNTIGHNLFIKGIVVEKNLSAELPRVRGDGRQLQQVFLSIINNALDAMKNGGVLGISTQLRDLGKQVLIRISDSGPGIDKKHIDKIFDPFFTTKPDGEGTGLGLSVSYGIIKRYGGNIKCQSLTAEAPGTAFIITLPVFENEGETKQPSAHKAGDD